MSPVTSRPVSQMKTGMSLPQIKHPMSTMVNPDSMDVRGASRAGGSRPTFSPPLTGRPLANEGSLTVRKSSSRTDRDREMKTMDRNKENHISSIPMPIIPDGIEVIYGDPATARLPIFGGRVVMGHADPQSRTASRASHTLSLARLEIDEIETSLKNKISHNFHELRKKFKDNDPEGQGNVSREALSRILATYLGRPVSSTTQRLLERMGFAERQVIAYSEFFSHFRDANSGYPQWMDPVNRPQQNRVRMASDQVHAHLKEKARKRYAPEHEETISGKRLLNALGIPRRDKLAEMPRRKSPVEDKAEPTARATRLPRKKELERQHQLNVEMWLKNKFREGFFNMRDAFQKRDPDRTGLVKFDDFIQVLTQFGLKLEKNLLAAFLSRCSIQAVDKHVPYWEFLHRFQDRGEGGITHSVLQEVHKASNRKDNNNNNKIETTFNAVQSQLTNMFQADFLALLAMFKKIDSLGTNVISQEEFRAAIESRFALELTDCQFESFIDHVPLDDEGNVMYVTFMQQFDGKGQAPSLFGPGPYPGKENQPDPPRKTDNETTSGNNLPSLSQQTVDPNLDMSDPHRSQQELFQIIKDLMSRNFHDLEQRFYELDEANTRRLTQDRMYHLLKSFDIQPEISRGEIRDLWSTFITKSDKTLDYLQFVRHFGFSMRSATFPNAKLQPPRRGDADFMIRSKRLNCAADILQDNLRAKVDYLWEDIRREFAGMDPYNTGCVSEEEFIEVLTELCPSLDNLELKHLTVKFQVKNDGRISYVEFLKPFTLKRQTCCHDNILGVIQESETEHSAPGNQEQSHAGLLGITNTLRMKLSGEWRNLRRAFKKLDVSGNGFLSLPEFRAVLKLANVVLDEEELYHVMNEFDPDLDGKIRYGKFIEETFKPESRRSVRST